MEEVWIVLIKPSGVRITRSLRTPAMLDADADQEARRLGVTRQAFIKVRLADSLVKNQ